MRKTIKVIAVATLVCAPSAVKADELIASGTAFLVSNDGWLLTNAHVIKKCTRVEVKGLGNSDRPKIDEINDLAALKVTVSKPLTPISFRKKPVRLGEDILAIGFPLSGILSDSIKVTTGNVNSLAGLGNDARYLQISTEIQPGNSGGPLVDKDGFLVGITTATFSKEIADKLGITAQNVNFAIRSSVAEVFLQSQAIAYSSADTIADQAAISTADLSEKITPSVFQVLCYGNPEVAAEVPTVASQTGVSPQVSQVPKLINANGYDAIGFDYSTLKDVAIDTCRTACENDSQCMAITFNKQYNFCFLKRDVVALIKNDDASSSYAASKRSQVYFSNFTAYRNMDFPGGDYLKLSGSNYTSCFLECAKDPVCKAFAYVRKKQQCWLKNRLGDARAIVGVDLGVK